MDIIKSYATKNDCYSQVKLMTPKGIVVHSTGCNNPYLKRYVDCPSELGTNIYGNHWNRSGLDVCVHAFIGYDKNKNVKIANILPYNYCCWGVGSGSKGSYNYNPAYIQFEMCEDDLTNKDYYNKVIETAVEYCAYLCKTYNISVDKIVSHKEAHKLGYGSNHGDCDHWLSMFGDTMDKFRQRVKAKLNKTATSSAVTSSYLVKVTTSALNIRSGAGTNYTKVGCITDKGVYTIIAESNGSGAKKWGKLKSGIGWISLDYCTKI